MPSPLHPALVHLPLGLSIVLPLLALAALVAAYRGSDSRPAAVVVLVLQGLLVLSGFAALQTGEAEEDRVERVVGEARLEQHEAYAQHFVFGAAVTLALAAAVVLLRGRPAARVLSAAVLAGTLVTAALGVRVGHAGGQLVYVHGAASAWAGGTGAPAQPPDHRDDDD